MQPSQMPMIFFSHSKKCPRCFFQLHFSSQLYLALQALAVPAIRLWPDDNAMKAGQLQMQVRSIGKRDYGGLFKLGDEMIQFGGLHTLLAGSVADMVPVNTSILLSEDAKRQARATGYGDAGGATAGPGRKASIKSFEDLMTSPWKVCAGTHATAC